MQSLHFLFMLFTLGNIGKEKGNALASRVDAALDPTPPGRVKRLHMDSFSLVQGPLDSFLKGRVERLGKFGPDMLAHEVFQRAAEHFFGTVIDVEETHVPIQAEEAFSHGFQQVHHAIIQGFPCVIDLNELERKADAVGQFVQHEKFFGVEVACAVGIEIECAAYFASDPNREGSRSLVASC